MQVSFSSLKRITPTYVGKTSSKPFLITARQDHPHLRGENPVCFNSQLSRSGSPPLTWGKLKYPGLELLYHRITPTYVGKTYSCVAVCCSRWDHPHLRGENGFQHLLHLRNQGSPPLTWGKLGRNNLLHQIARITPTYVGKTTWNHRSIQKRKDHPHLRGENSTIYGKIRFFLGSPPLTWGKPMLLFHIALIRRITPTYVGKTSFHPNRHNCTEDHPHLRGENAVNQNIVCAAEGSPPLTWGKLIMKRRKIVLDRITPTYVGKTLKKSLN